MIKEAVLHMPLSQYAYAVCENKLIIRIRTAKDDVLGVSVFYGDRVAYVEPIPVTKVPMDKCASDDLFDYYEAEITTDLTRVCYYFEICDGKETYYYYSRGFTDKMTAHRTEYFQYPYIRREEVVNIPAWAYDSVMYHIFPDSFANEKRAIGGKENLSLETPGGISINRLGGTLRGIIENLDYIKGLGVNLLYLNPIFMAGSYHKYDTIDYFKIDPCLGTEEDFKELVDKIHENGMHIILDGVFNHCGPDFFAFKDILENGEKSKYCHWFYKLRFPIEYTDTPNYECFAYVKEMPKLNTSDPEVRDYICKVGQYWIREFGIDGWRLDVANEIDHDTWRAFKKAVISVKKDAFLIAEIWEDADVWLKGDQFHSAMNYTFTYLCRDFFAGNRISAIEFDQQMQKSLMRYPRPVANAQMNFLDSHDVPRFLSYCEGNKNKLMLATFYLVMAPGIPSVFYGDECFIEGVTESEYRSPMAWDKAGGDFSFDINKWISIRENSDAIKMGDYKGLYADEDGLYIFSRAYNGKSVYVVINNSDVKRLIRIEEMACLNKGLINLVTGEGFEGDLMLDAYSGLVLE